MSYVVKLNDINSAMLEGLAKQQNMGTCELIERLVVGYLDSQALDNRDSVSWDKASPTLLPKPKHSEMKSLYAWDEKSAAFVFTPTDERVFFMNAHSWRATERDILTRLPERGPSLLTSMGAAYGVAATLDYQSVADGPEKLMLYFVHLGLVAGWGKFSLSGDLAKGSEIIVRVRDCVFCGRRDQSASRSDRCYFIMGACKGIADTLFDSLHSVQETKCHARGDDFCEILVSAEKS